MILRILTYFFAAFLLFGAIMHQVQPEMYAPLIPDFVPENVANILATITELVVGLMLIIPKYRSWGGLGFMILMTAFLPLHIWDLTKDAPLMGSKIAAAIRLVFQFLMIYAGWRIYTKNK